MMPVSPACSAYGACFCLICLHVMFVFFGMTFILCMFVCLYVCMFYMRCLFCIVGTIVGMFVHAHGFSFSDMQCSACMLADRM